MNGVNAPSCLTPASRKSMISHSSIAIKESASDMVPDNCGDFVEDNSFQVNLLLLGSKLD